jgi:hypothetical protein
MAKKESDLIPLVNIFLSIVEASKGESYYDDNRYIDAEGLTL